MQPQKIIEQDFGVIEFHDSYAIGRIDPAFKVDTRVAKAILQAVNQHFGKRKMVYISDRELSHDVDTSVYRYIDYKKMIGIAIVSSKREEAISSASKEQAVYKGSFGVFHTMDSAVSWAKSVVEDHNE